MSQQKVLALENLNANVRKCRYEVRGEIYLAAVKRAQEGKEVIYTNVGNPHALGQVPLTFMRQVLALLMAPKQLLENPAVLASFPSDTVERARTYLAQLKGGLGAYSDSKGNPYIRQEIADFIMRQTGVPSNPDNIFISNGASECARMILQAVIRGPADGIMVPIPQYPLYSASIALYGGQLVPYYLNEDEGWSLDIDELAKSLEEARAKGICTRALVFINPGNPTGQCLSEANLRDLIAFCYANKIVLLADEVYQENIYTSKQFVPAKRILGQMPEPIRSGLELISFHTVSKGAYGECGLRGGYMELHNIDPLVVQEIYKMASINLSPNVTGQVALGIMVNPPKPGDPSHASFIQEKKDLIASLQRRARRITDAFNALEGIVCQETEGAMYCFPRIAIPPAAQEAAKAMGKQPDVLYCLELLDQTGICCVPGSGFQQSPGTFHLRTTILPPEEKFDEIVSRFKAFHENFLRKYSGSGAVAHRSKL